MARRRTDFIGVIGSLTVIVITATLIISINAQHTPATPDVAPAEATMLLQFRDGSGSAVGNLVLAGGDQLSVLALPPTLLVPTPEPVPLSSTPGERDTLAARNGVSSLLGVRLDVVVSIDRLALTALVDSVGGAPLDVPDRFVERDGLGAPVLAIFPGARVLPGTSAASYAMVRQQGEPETARIQRLSAVMSRVLNALPESSDELRALILSLGASARSSASTDVVAATIGAIRDAANGGIITRIYPVIPLVGDVASVPKEPDAIAAVRSALPSALLLAGQSPLTRIELRRAGASAGRVRAAQQALIDDGDAVVGLESGEEQSPVVIVPNQSSAARVRGIAIAEALGLPTWAVRASQDPLPLPQPDAIVFLGSDIG